MTLGRGGFRQLHAVTRSALPGGDEIGVDGGRLAVVGASVGGNTAAVVSLMAKNKQGPAIRFQGLMWPAPVASCYPYRTGGGAEGRGGIGRGVVEKLISSVAGIMRQSADLAILPRYRSLQTHEVSEKSASDFVTIADRESEALLAEGLARLLPEATIVGEEAAHADPALLDRLGDALCWIIDPLDGTNNFAAGKPPFGILVALAERGETIAGWIYDPLTGRCCHARRGGGAFVNGERVNSVGSGQARPVVAIALELVDPRRIATTQKLLEHHFSTVANPRCAAEQYARIALGQNDIAFFNRTFAWDHAAGVLFLNEAGGKAARYDGSPYRVNDDRVGLLAAATPPMWDRMIELLRAN